MDRCFNIKLNTSILSVNGEKIRTHKDEHKTKVKSLSKLMMEKDTFDASLILTYLFPDIEADIFLSHSYCDLDQAIQIAKLLEEKCGLKVFIDSCVWGSAYDLFKAIDQRYCRRPDQANYDYDERYRATAHIHMILTTALQRMVDKTDTILFMNTDQSISLKHSVDGKIKTLSPWIHMELNFCSMVRRKPRSPTNALDEQLSKRTGNESFSVAHDAPLDRFTTLSEKQFAEWFEFASKNNGAKAIDHLYNLY
ncbi:hypothetical protein [Pseudomonas brassicacearum]|uniref:hypothetical protein n=1 Tax=Pseudomonas brassicacearum TaxID=930166 RepID=UPI003ED03071